MTERAFRMLAYLMATTLGLQSTDLTALQIKDIAGEYWRSDGFFESESLLILEDGSFLQRTHGCLGVYGSFSGRFDLLNGVISLVVSDESRAEDMHLHGSRFVFIRWDRRRYLVHEKDVELFLHVVLMGTFDDAGRGDRFYLRKDGRNSVPLNPPVVPVPWLEKFANLSSSIVSCTVTSLEPESGIPDHLAVVNVGRAGGLREGMTLFAGTPARLADGGAAHIDRGYPVIDVQEQTSKARIGHGPGSVQKDDSMFAVIWRSRESARSAEGASQRQATEAAEKLLRELSARYAALRSYRDRGVVLDQDEGGTALGPQQQFRTAFIRPDQFRFSYLDVGSGRPRDIVHRNRDGARQWNPHMGVHEGSPSELDGHIAAATGVSRGTAHTVPALLMPEEIGGRSLIERLRGSKLAGEETIREQACFRLEHTDVHGDLTHVWIEKKRLLILQIEEFIRIGDAVKREVTEYYPEADIDIPESDLAFDPPL